MTKATHDSVLNFESLHGFEELPFITEYEKKTNLTDSECYSLRYAAIYFFSKNEMITDWRDFDDKNSMCDDELYINNFEGIYISEHQSIKTVFLTVDNVIVLSVYDDQADIYLNYMAQ